MRWLGRGHQQSVHCEIAGRNVSVKWPEREDQNNENELHGRGS